MKRTRRIQEALNIGQKEFVAFVGAGGKTSLMSELAKELLDTQRTVLVTTTTKVWNWQARDIGSLVFTESSETWREALNRAIGANGCAFLARRPLASGKVQGIGPDLADELYERQVADCVLVEADGASGKPLKAPADHEPVIPTGTTLAVGLMGADALGKQCSEDTVFRLDRFLKITGAQRNDAIVPALLAKLAAHEMGLFKGCPRAARKVVFLNRIDLLAELGPVDQLATMVEGPMGIIAGSVRSGSYLVYRGG